MQIYSQLTGKSLYIGSVGVFKCCPGAELSNKFSCHYAIDTADCEAKDPEPSGFLRRTGALGQSEAALYDLWRQHHKVGIHSVGV